MKLIIQSMNLTLNPPAMMLPFRALPHDFLVMAV
jgi:hypothetical protein